MTPRRSQVNNIPEGEESALRQLETIVLTQVRDSLALMNSNLAKLDAQVERINNSVTTLSAQDFSAQIKVIGEAHRGEIDKLWAAHTKHDDRLTAQAVQLARYGLGMAISASIGSLSLGAVIAVAVTRILGAH